MYEMSCPQDISLTRFRRILSRTIRLHSTVLAFVSPGYIRGRRPGLRRAAASSTAHSSPPNPRRGLSPLPSPRGPGGMVCPPVGAVSGAGGGVGRTIHAYARPPISSGPARTTRVAKLPSMMVVSSNSPPIPRATTPAVGGFRFRRSFRLCHPWGGANFPHSG
jgi:hypothetical protein